MPPPAFFIDRILDTFFGVNYGDPFDPLTSTVLALELWDGDPDSGGNPLVDPDTLATWSQGVPADLGIEYGFASGGIKTYFFGNNIVWTADKNYGSAAGFTIAPDELRIWYIPFAGGPYQMDIGATLLHSLPSLTWTGSPDVGGMTLGGRQRVLGTFFGSINVNPLIAPAPSGNWEFGLYDGVPNAGGSQPSAPDYVPPQIFNGTSEFSNPPDHHQLDNLLTWDFPVSATDWGVLTHWGLRMVYPTDEPLCYHSGALPSPIDAVVGTKIRVPAGGFRVLLGAP